LLVQFFGDVAVGDRTEQAAVDAGLLRQLDGRAAELFALRLRFGQLGGRGLFEFGALGFEFGLVGFGGAAGAARGDQEVACVAVLDLDDLAEGPG
jgi:hypothetical protein